MKRILKNALFFISLFFIFQSCGEDFDDVIHFRTSNEFIWKGMNEYYYWQEESVDLGDSRFNTTVAFQNFVNEFETPEKLFKHLLVEQKDINATTTKLAVGTNNQVLIVKVTSKDNAVVTKKVIN